MPNLQNSSPKSSAESPSAFRITSRHDHSHSGYSSSFFATGSSFPLMKLRPWKTVPSGQLDRGAASFADASPGLVVGVERAGSAAFLNS